MIRLLLLTIVPLILPFAIWFAWNVFAEKPELDPATGEQLPPELKNAPVKMLAAIGVLLSMLTLGGFLLFHEQMTDKPYTPINIDEAEKELERGVAPDRPVSPR